MARGGGGGPPSPLPGVSLIARSFRDVCLLDGQVEGVAVKVGLDSMSSNSLISASLAKQLGSRICAVQKQPIEIATAGDGELVRVDSFVNVQVQVGNSEVVRMDLGVMELPVDVLIGWQDIIHKGFWSLLCAAAGGGLPELSEVAPEEFHEDSYDPMALVAAETGPVSPQLQVLISEFPDVLTGDLPRGFTKGACEVGGYEDRSEGRCRSSCCITSALSIGGGEKVYGRVCPEVIGRRFYRPIQVLDGVTRGGRPSCG
jgi:hypothetical protein